jgi:methionine aminotransferase
MWTDEDYRQLITIFEDHDCLLLSDEVYDLITFNKAHTTALAIPELRDRAFVVMSFGKLVHATGWKVGACIASPELTSEFRKVHQYLAFSANTPMQHGLAAYTSNASVFESLPHVLRAKRDLFSNALQGTNWLVRPCEGTYFQLLDYSSFWQGADVSLAEQLARIFKVAAIPLSPFTNGEQRDSALRFCFAKQEHVLLLAAERLRAASEQLSTHS